MRVTGPSSTSSASSARRAGPKRANGFAATEETDETRSAAGLTGATGVGSLEALLALQGAEADPDTEVTVSGRAARRAGGILDALDALKLALLEGRALNGRLGELAAAAARAREATGDDRLEAILNEVETRAAVELAKYAAA
jgi:hypothetical protein